MKQTVTFTQFTDAFENAGRQNDFTYEGKKALFDYLEQWEEDLGLEIELDTIALCGEYVEYATLEELFNDYSNLFDRDFNEYTLQEIEEILTDNATLIPVGDGYIIQA